jgi:hypothetical protein
MDGITAKVGVPEQLEATIKSLADTYQVVVAKFKSLAKPACRKCHGRGYTGTNVKTGQLMPCRCYVKAYIKKEAAKDGRQVVEKTGIPGVPSHVEQPAAAS